MTFSALQKSDFRYLKQSKLREDRQVPRAYQKVSTYRCLASRVAPNRS